MDADQHCAGRSPDEFIRALCISHGQPAVGRLGARRADGAVAATPPRDSLRAIQTPQAFAFTPLLEAHRAAAAAGLDSFTDDGALAEWAGLPVTVFEGDAAEEYQYEIYRYMRGAALFINPLQSEPTPTPTPAPAAATPTPESPHGPTKCGCGPMA